MQEYDVGVLVWQVGFLYTVNWGPRLLLPGGFPAPGHHCTQLVRGGGGMVGAYFLKKS